jgi:hypothetical protein
MGFILVLFGFWFYLGVWQIASRLSLPIRCIFIPKIFENKM